MVDVGAYFSCNEIVKKAKIALGVYSQFSQKQVDMLLRSVYLTILENRKNFAELSISESGFGNLTDKIKLCGISTQSLYSKLKDIKTVGITNNNEHPAYSVIKNRTPIGVIACKVSSRLNLNSIISIILFSIKTRNPLILASCLESEKTIREIVRVCYDTAIKNGAPDDCLQFIGNCSTPEYEELAKDQRVSKHFELDVDTFVFSYIGESADISLASQELVKSKSFDNGLLSCTETFLFVHSSVYDSFLNGIDGLGGFFLNQNFFLDLQKQELDKFIGLSAYEISRKLGLEVPQNTKLLLVEANGIDNYLLLNKIFNVPILFFAKVNSIEDVTKFNFKINNDKKDKEILATIFSNDENEILIFDSELEISKLLVNVPASFSIATGAYDFSTFSIIARDLFSGDISFVDIKDFLRINTILKRRLDQSYRDMDLSLYNDESISACDLDKRFNLNI